MRSGHDLRKAEHAFGRRALLHTPKGTFRATFGSAAYAKEQSAPEAILPRCCGRTFHHKPPARNQPRNAKDTNILSQIISPVSVCVTFLGRRRGGALPVHARHRGGGCGLSRHVRLHSVLARRVLTALRHARRGVRAAARRPPLKRPEAHLFEPKGPAPAGRCEGEAFAQIPQGDQEEGGRGL